MRAFGLTMQASMGVVGLLSIAIGGLITWFNSMRDATREVIKQTEDYIAVLNTLWGNIDSYYKKLFRQDEDFFNY